MPHRPAPPRAAPLPPQAALDARSWIGEREKVLLLNQCTEVINYWQVGAQVVLRLPYRLSWVIRLG